MRRRIVKATRWPPVGRADLGDLRRTSPISRQFGMERGEPVDRHYIDGFLRRCSADVQGHVLEVGTDHYTRKVGADRVTRSDVLHVASGHPGATMVGSLSDPDGLPVGEFDCFILTQTLHLVYEVSTALKTAHQMLAPGGVLLATVPGISQICRYDADRWGDYWRFTSWSARRLVEEAFPGGIVEVMGYGNVLSAAAFLYGLAREELTPEELDHRDEDFELIVAIRAVKAGES